MTNTIDTMTTDFCPCTEYSMGVARRVEELYHQCGLASVATIDFLMPGVDLDLIVAAIRGLLQDGVIGTLEDHLGMDTVFYVSC